MSSPTLPIKVVELLTRPAPAVMATVGSDGRPVTATAWFLLQPDHTILFALGAGRARVRHVQLDPRISLTVLDSHGSGTHVTLQGWTDGVFTDNRLRDIDRLSEHYTGRPYPDRTSPRVSLRMHINDWRLERRSFGFAL